MLFIFNTKILIIAVSTHRNAFILWGLCVKWLLFRFNFITFIFEFVHFCHFYSIKWLQKSALRECDVDKRAITGAIFVCHICGRHDPRLALLMLNVRCESQGLSSQAPGKAARPNLACHPSLVPLGCHSCVTVPLSQTADPTEDAAAAAWSNISLG